MKMQLNKKALQEENEALKHEIEQLRKTNGALQAEKLLLFNGTESLKDTTQQQDKRIDSLNEIISGMKKEIDETKKRAAGYKQELDGLTDTKSILRDIKFRLDGPAAALNKRIEELETQITSERNRASNMERDLYNRHEDSQRIQFLEGKVQAYEAMFRVNPVRTAWGGNEPVDMLL